MTTIDIYLVNPQENDLGFGIRERNKEQKEIHTGVEIQRMQIKYKSHG